VPVNASISLPRSFSCWRYSFAGRVRAKVDDPFEKKLIHTIRGVGYVLEE
jgi:hypothetical protein